MKQKSDNECSKNTEKFWNLISTQYPNSNSVEEEIQSFKIILKSIQESDIEIRKESENNFDKYFKIFSINRSIKINPIDNFKLPCDNKGLIASIYGNRQTIIHSAFHLLHKFKDYKSIAKSLLKDNNFKIDVIIYRDLSMTRSCASV